MIGASQILTLPAIDVTIDRPVAPTETQTPARMQVAGPGGGTALSDAAPVDSDLYGEWSELAEHAGVSPFTHPGWIATWADAFADRPLSVIAVRREGRLVGIVPVLPRATGVVSPPHRHTPRFGLVASDARARDELAARLVGRARHRLHISFLDEGSDDVRAFLDAAAGAGPIAVCPPR